MNAISKHLGGGFVSFAALNWIRFFYIKIYGYFMEILLQMGETHLNRRREILPTELPRALHTKRERNWT